MKSQKSCLFSSLMVILGLASCTPAPDSPVESDLGETLSQILDHWGSPGASVSVVMDGETVFQEGFGSTTAAGGSSVSPKTLAPVQSVSKPFTAVALSMLVEDGMIGWDAPVQRYIPEFEFGGDYLTTHITVRDLIAHRAGTPFLLGGWEPSSYSIDDILRDLKTEEPTIQLRAGVYYSQVGMALLGEIIQRVSGQSWSDLVKERILGPLSMTSSYPDDPHLMEALGPLDAIPALMKTVSRTQGVLEDVPWQSYNELWWPAGALITNAEDMASFMAFLLGDGLVHGEPLLSAELISEMMSPTEIPGLDVISPLEPIVDPRAEFVAYGLGWMVHEEFGKRIVEHGGAGRSSATVALIPEEDLGVFVVTNASFGNESARLVSAMKFAALEHFLGLPKTDWIGVLDPGS